MANNINSGSGSIYFRNDRKKWMARYWEYDVMKDRNVKKTKTFESKEDAEEFLKQLNYRRENPIYIKNNGIPLFDLMLTNLDNKKNANLISQAQYDRVKVIAGKSFLLNKSFALFWFIPKSVATSFTFILANGLILYFSINKTINLFLSISLLFLLMESFNKSIFLINCSFEFSKLSSMLIISFIKFIGCTCFF